MNKLFYIFVILTLFSAVSCVEGSNSERTSSDSDVGKIIGTVD